MRVGLSGLSLGVSTLPPQALPLLSSLVLRRVYPALCSSILAHCPPSAHASAPAALRGIADLGASNLDAPGCLSPDELLAFLEESDAPFPLPTPADPPPLTAAPPPAVALPPPDPDEPPEAWGVAPPSPAAAPDKPDKRSRKRKSSISSPPPKHHRVSPNLPPLPELRARGRREEGGRERGVGGEGFERFREGMKEWGRPER